MATTKKSTAKRSSSTASKTSKKPAPRSKATPAKKSASTRARSTSTTKRATGGRKTRVSRSKSPEMKSFRVAKAQEPFMSLKITVQTLYWLILAGAVLLLGLWVLDIHNKVQNIYDEIDQSTILQQELDAKELQMLREKAEEAKNK